MIKMSKVPKVRRGTFWFPRTYEKILKWYNNIFIHLKNVTCIYFDILLVCPIWLPVFFLNKPELGEVIDPGIALPPFTSSILEETRFEPTAFWLWVEFANHSLKYCYINVFICVNRFIKKLYAKIAGVTRTYITFE